MTRDKKRVILFGARATGRLVHEWIRDESDIICYVDNDPSLWGTIVLGAEVRSPELVSTLEYDRIFICSWSIGSIRSQLLKLGIPSEKIDDSHAQYTIRARTVWLRDFARQAYDCGFGGNVAEAGVYLGGYAREINTAFPDRTLYLFDTFEGFDARDFPFEEDKSWVEGSFAGSSLAQVQAVMPHIDKCVFKKGYFPATTEGVDDSFYFVHLDMDMYHPTLAGLQFFYPKLVAGGVVAVHDYFSSSFPNVKKAVREFANSVPGGIKTFPIGDAVSIGIIR